MFAVDGRWLVAGGLQPSGSRRMVHSSRRPKGLRLPQTDIPTSRQNEYFTANCMMRGSPATGSARSRAVEIRHWARLLIGLLSGPRPEPVERIERLDPRFDPLCVEEPEQPHQRQIDSPAGCPYRIRVAA